VLQVCSLTALITIFWKLHYATNSAKVWQYVDSLKPFLSKSVSPVHAQFCSITTGSKRCEVRFRLQSLALAGYWINAVNSLCTDAVRRNPATCRAVDADIQKAIKDWLRLAKTGTAVASGELLPALPVPSLPSCVELSVGELCSVSCVITSITVL